ncbi:MAG: hypothetical protein RMK29_00840 [Myxococcales bacterium]|nr:hypothetical protein [Myxococcota bacterium]MDW8280224.1 hypothetical protein [Myxococcales bacterium]
MRDLFDAIEQLGTLLAMRIERAAGRRGWACKVVPYQTSPAPGRVVHLVTLTLNMPQGFVASVVPRSEPEDGTWVIDIRRADGVTRRSWVKGLRVVRAGDTYVIHGANGILTDEQIDSLLDDLSRPGPSGLALWVRKVWAMRFGRLPVELSELLETTKDADRLDLMHAAVLRAVDMSDAAAQLWRIGKADTEAPLSS